MRRALLLTIAGLALLALAVVAFAPAALLASRVSSATGGALTLAEATGPWWNGRATLVARDGTRLPVGWRIDPGALLAGVVRVGLRPGDDPAAPRGEIEWRDGQLRLSGLALTAPARLAAQAIPFRSGRERIDVDGDLGVATAELSWPPRGTRGDATLRWDRARLALPDGGPSIALGEVTLRLAATGDRLAGPVANTGGDVALAGTVDAGADGRVRVSLLATPREGADPRLVQMLATVGTPEGAGVRVAFTVGAP